MASRSPPQQPASRPPPRDLPPAPWLSIGTRPALLTVDSEITSFLNFVTLQRDELTERRAAVAAVHAAARSVRPNCAVQEYGSVAIGTAFASSAVDVIVSRCGRISEEEAAAVARRVGEVRAVYAVGDGAFASVAAEGGFDVLIQFDAGAAAATVESVAVARRWVAEFPALRAAHAVFRQILVQSKKLAVTNGGLSSYALLTMLVHAARAICAAGRRPGKDLTPAALVVGAAEYYKLFDFCSCVVDASTPVAQLRGPGESVESAVLVVRDPCRHGNNIAQGSSLLPVSHFWHCSQALSRWSRSACHNWGREFKGRTPLSSVISHQPLWSRAACVGSIRRVPALKSPQHGGRPVSPAPSTSGMTDTETAGSASPTPADPDMPDLVDA